MLSVKGTSFSLKRMGNKFFSQKLHKVFFTDVAINYLNNPVKLQHQSKNL